MTRRRDRNRDARRAAAAIANVYVCPDCSADKRLTEHTPGVFVLDVAHDETCPAYRAMTESSPGGPHAD